MTSVTASRNSRGDGTGGAPDRITAALRCPPARTAADPSPSTIDRATPIGGAGVTDSSAAVAGGRWLRRATARLSARVRSDRDEPLHNDLLRAGRPTDRPCTSMIALINGGRGHP